MPNRAVYATTGLWLLTMLILKLDAFDLDTATIVTLLVAIFGLMLHFNQRLDRVEFKLGIIK